jgi:hypothetical protein
MLFKDRKEYNKLIQIFDYGGFSIYDLKATEALDIVFNAKKVERLISR